ncbi:MAG: flagellar basal body P-ring formation chaperone FlgA [Pseudobdellovibrionaceae bacterium]
MKVLTFLFIALLVSWAWAFKAEIRIAEKSTVRIGDPIRLGSLIQGEVRDPELSARLHDLVIFEALVDESEKTYQSEELALTLRQKLSFQDLQKVAVKIPEQFKIQARRNFLYPNDIKREISEQAQVKCLGCTIEFDDLNMPEIKNKGEVLKTRMELQALKGAGSFLIPLIVETSQGKGTYWITGKLSFYKLAPVTKRLLRANERISSEDFEMKKVDVSFAKDGIPTSESVAGKMAARMLTVGQPIFESDLKKEPAAQRGQSVKILVGNDSFEIATQGTAEESGSVGDLIKVKSADTKKLFTGVLIEKGVVRLQ